MKQADRRVADALKLRDELTEARLSRRELAKLGLVAGSAYFGVRGLALRAALAKDIRSPRTRPWLEPLPLPEVLRPGAPLADYDDKAHQYCHGYYEPKKYYVLRVQERPHRFHPDLPASPIWGYGGSFPGPTIDARYGEPILIRTVNELPSLAQHKGFGIPQLATHVHNFHTAPASDGGPWNWLDPGKQRDQHYCMMRAGFSEPGKIPAEWRDAWGGDKRETLTTLFMHDHRPEFTAANVYKGLVNFVRIFDEDDTGDETTGWRLPSGPYDIPLALADKQFDPRTGLLAFDQFATDGFLGDKITVNGKIQPFLEVKRRKYRFRVLSGGPSRFYRLVLRQAGKNQPFTQITESGNFLEFPRQNLTSLELWVAERSDIIVDFSRFKPGDRVYLCNTLEMRDDGRGEKRGKSPNPDRIENQLLEFRILPDQVGDPSRIPSRFRPVPPIDLNEVVRTRVWRFERKNGAWAINGQFWDPDIDHSPAFLASPPNQVKRNTAEVWVLESSSGGWDHPIHIHFEEGITFRKNGITVAPGQRFRTDMHRMSNGTRHEVLMRFRDFPQPGFVGESPGRFVMHCHNTVHEDHAMMTTFNIVP